MTYVSRRMLLLGGVSSLVAATISVPLAAADTRKRFPACGCVDPYPDSGCSNCLTHDERGRRWDSYTGHEVAALYGYEVHEADGEEECCDSCGYRAYEPMEAGTPFAAWVSGYYEPEAEQQCLDCLRADWLNVTTTDWYGMHLADRAQHGQGLQKERGL